MYVGFLGKGSYDLAIYLCTVLRNLQYKVLLADALGDDLFSFMYSTDSNNNNDIVTFKKIDFIKCGRNFTLSDNCSRYLEYDYVIVLSEHTIGQNMMTHNIVNHSVDYTYKYLVTDTRFINVTHMLEALKHMDKVDGIIFRDVTESVSSEFIIKHILKDDYLTKLYDEKKVFCIKDDLINSNYYINMQYSGFSSYKNLSKDFEFVIKDIVRTITNKEKGAINKALTRAKEGVIFEHSILE